jgi:hypothetical protein
MPEKKIIVATGDHVDDGIAHGNNVDSGVGHTDAGQSCSICGKRAA